MRLSSLCSHTRSRRAHKVEAEANVAAHTATHRVPTCGGKKPEVALYEMPRPHGRAMGVDQARTFSSNDTLPIDDAIFDQRCGSSDDTFRVMMRQPRRGETPSTAPGREPGETSERPGKSPSGATPFFHCRCTRLPNRSAPSGATRFAPNRVPRLAPWAFKTVPPLRG